MADASLDERWRTFVSATDSVARDYPHLWPVRQTVFRSLADRRESESALEPLKDMARALLKRGKTRIAGGSPDVLFWLDTPRLVIVDLVRPVARALRERGRNVRFLSTPEAAGALGHDWEESTLSFEAPPLFAPERDWEGAWKALQAIPNLGLTSEQHGAFLTLGKRTDSVRREALRVLKELRPKYLVLGTDHQPPASVICQAAQELGIPTLVLQHGIVQALYTPLTADRMAVWGETSADVLRSFGEPPDRLLPLGCPRYDLLPHQDDAAAATALRSTLGLNEQPLFVFFSNGNDASRNTSGAMVACAAWLAEAARALDGQVQIAVRLHPNEEGELYAGLPKLRIFKSECSVFLTMAGADAIGSLCSTALLEALLYGKPVLQFWADGWPLLADNWKRNLAERTASGSQLIEQLHALAAGELPHTRRAAALAFANAGRSAEVIADEIEAHL